MPARQNLGGESSARARRPPSRRLAAVARGDDDEGSAREAPAPGRAPPSGTATGRAGAGLRARAVGAALTIFKGARSSREAVQLGGGTDRAEPARRAPAPPPAPRPSRARTARPLFRGPEEEEEPEEQDECGYGGHEYDAALINSPPPPPMPPVSSSARPPPPAGGAAPPRPRAGLAGRRPRAAAAPLPSLPEVPAGPSSLPALLAVPLPTPLGGGPAIPPADYAATLQAELLSLAERSNFCRSASLCCSLNSALKNAKLVLHSTCPCPADLRGTPPAPPAPLAAWPAPVRPGRWARSCWEMWRPCCIPLHQAQIPPPLAPTPATAFTSSASRPWTPSLPQAAAVARAAPQGPALTAPRTLQARARSSGLLELPAWAGPRHWPSQSLC